MNRNQFRAYFERAFPELDHTRVVSPGKVWYYAHSSTRYAWMGYVAAFETYAKEYISLSGEYEEQKQRKEFNHAR